MLIGEMYHQSFVTNLGLYKRGSTYVSGVFVFLKACYKERNKENVKLYILISNIFIKVLRMLKS